MTRVLSIRIGIPQNSISIFNSSEKSLVRLIIVESKYGGEKKYHASENQNEYAARLTNVSHESLYNPLSEDVL